MSDALHQPDSPGALCFARMTGALQAVERRPSAPARQRRAEAGALQGEAATAVAEAERLMREGQGEAALAHCELCWPLVEGADSAELLGAVWHVRAVCHEHAGRLRAAMEAGYRAIAAYEATAAVERSARMLSLQALVLAQLGDVAEALGLLERAATLLPRLADSPRDLCVFWMNVAATHEVLGDLGRAIEAGERSVRSAEAMTGHEALAAHTVGHLLCYRMALEEASPGSAAHEQATAQVRAHLLADRDAGRLDVLPFRADACARSLILAGRLDEARELLRLGLDAASRTGNLAKRGVLEMRSAELERLGGGFKAASGHIGQALDLLTRSDDRRELAAAHLENSRLHEAQQRWRAALDCFKRYAELHEEWLHAQANIRAQALMIRLELRRTGLGAGLLRSEP